MHCINLVLIGLNKFSTVVMTDDVFCSSQDVIWQLIDQQDHSQSLRIDKGTGVIQLHKFLPGSQ